MVVSLGACTDNVGVAIVRRPDATVLDAPPALNTDAGVATEDTAAGAGTDAGIADGAGVADPARCEYPAAPELTATRFAIGSVAPNLRFTREDGTTLTFKDIRCNRKNRLLIWSIGGDTCGPCYSKAKKEAVPAWKALAAEGLFVLESFNGQGFLVTPSPFPPWHQHAQWPMDGDGIAVVREPESKPYYAFGRISAVYGIPWHYMIDLETMKVVNVEGPLTVESLRMRMKQLPPRR